MNEVSASITWPSPETLFETAFMVDNPVMFQEMDLDNIKHTGEVFRGGQQGKEQAKGNIDILNGIVE